MTGTCSNTTTREIRDGFVATIALGAVVDHMREHHLAARGDIRLPDALDPEPSIGLTCFSHQVQAWMNSGLAVDAQSASPSGVAGYTAHTLAGRLPDGTRVRLVYVARDLQAVSA